MTDDTFRCGDRIRGFFGCADFSFHVVDVKDNRVPLIPTEWHEMNEILGGTLTTDDEVGRCFD